MNPRLVDPDDYRDKVFAWARSAKLKTVRLMIYQPKAAGVTEYVMPMDELEAFAKELHSRADRVRVADAMFTQMPLDEWAPIYLNPTPNDVECAFCRALSVCPAVQAKLQRDAGLDFGAVAEDQDAAATVEKTVTAAKPLDLSTAMEVAPLMESWLKSVRAEVERRLMAGEEVPRFGLELGRQGNREFRDMEVVEDLLRRQYRLKTEHVYTLKLKSPTQLEKLSKPSKREDGTIERPMIGTKRWRALEALVQRAPPKPSVRPLVAIKDPWTPPRLSAEGFTAVADTDELT